LTSTPGELNAILDSPKVSVLNVFIGFFQK